MECLKVALLGPYPTAGCLEPSRIRPSRRQRTSHPVPWIRLFCEGLSKQSGIQVELFSHSRDVSSVQQGFIGTVPCWFIPKFEPGNLDPLLGCLTARIQMAPLIRRFDPDVIVGFGTESMYGLLASEFKKPSAIFIQGVAEKIPLASYGVPAWAHPFLRHIERRAIHRATAVLAENRFAADWARSVNPQIQTAAVPHAVSPEFFEIKSDYSPKIVFVGEINSNKRPDMAIRAFAQVASRHPDAELVIVGAPGDLSAVLPALIREKGLAEKVRLTGPLKRNEVMSELSRARVLVLASLMDTSPNVITEARAAGLPVIATRTGGIPEMVEEGTDGFLVDLHDEEAMAGYMDRLLSDRDLAIRMGAAGRQCAAEKNQLSTVAPQYADFLHALAGRQQGTNQEI